MHTQAEKARAFARLHVKGNPLVLHNIWDAGSAKAIAETGAVAVATGSWSVAAAQGYADGENIPLDLLATIIENIVRAVDLPVSVDIEGGYGRDAAALHHTAERVIDAGAIGINFEDQLVGGDGIYCTEEQAARIAMIRGTASERNIPLFINARTDLFLQSKGASEHPGLLEATVERAHAYHDAGASGLFVPGLIDEALIAQLCDASPLPVNIMMMQGAPDISRLATLGVSRISYGPLPYVVAMQKLRDFAAGIAE